MLIAGSSLLIVQATRRLGTDAVQSPTFRLLVAEALKLKLVLSTAGLKLHQYRRLLNASFARINCAKMTKFAAVTVIRAVTTRNHDESN